MKEKNIFNKAKVVDMNPKVNHTIKAEDLLKKKKVKIVLNDFNWSLENQLNMIQGKRIKIGWLYIEGNKIFSEPNFSEDYHRAIFLHKCAYATFLTMPKDATEEQKQQGGTVLKGIVYTGNPEDCLRFNQERRKHKEGDDVLIKYLEENNIPYKVKHNTVYENDEEYKDFAREGWVEETY